MKSAGHNYGKKLLARRIHCIYRCIKYLAVVHDNESEGQHPCKEAYLLLVLVICI